MLWELLSNKFWVRLSKLSNMLTSSYIELNNGIVEILLDNGQLCINFRQRRYYLYIITYFIILLRLAVTNKGI